MLPFNLSQNFNLLSIFQLGEQITLCVCVCARVVSKLYLIILCLQQASSHSRLLCSSDFAVYIYDPWIKGLYCSCWRMSFRTMRMTLLMDISIFELLNTKVSGFLWKHMLLIVLFIVLSYIFNKMYISFCCGLHSLRAWSLIHNV